MGDIPATEKPPQTTSSSPDRIVPDADADRQLFVNTGEITRLNGNVKLTAGHDFNQTDWSEFSTLVVGLENPTDTPQRVKLKLSGASEGHNSAGASFETTVQPGAKTKWQLPIFHLRYTPGTDYPASPGVGPVVGRGMLDTSRVTSIDLETSQSDGSRALKLTGISLHGQVNPDRWIDPYGQNTNVTYPGKILTDADLIAADVAEAGELGASIPDPERNNYQGWKSATQLKATGFFRTEQINNRWWFVDPEGAPFYSTGLNCISAKPFGPVDGVTGKAYSWLPPAEGKYGQAVNSAGASLYVSNLIRKWGDDALPQSQSRALARQFDWGFTTLGNWTDSRLNSEHKLPYMSPGPDIASLHIPYIEGALCDVFHPDFEKEANRVASALSGTKDDKWLVGYFVDNELPWTNMTNDILKAKPDLPARQHLMAMLQAKYKDIESLNAAWGTTATSFDNLGPPDPKLETAACKKDLAAFRGEFAEKFYAVWYDAIKKADPNHLVLGSRFCDRHEEVVEACGRHTDVVSFNFYRNRFDTNEFDRYYAKVHKPFMIGEYGFNSLDTGSLTAAVLVDNQTARGIAYSAYTESVAASPNFIGSHFFQYVDEPLTGRIKDRESSYNGFVSVTDIPHKPIVNYARWTNSRIYRVHAGTEPPFVAPEQKQP